MEKTEPLDQSVAIRHCPWMNNFEIINMHMKLGTTLKIKGKVANNPKWMEINLGQSADKLNLHFKIVFPESVILCNSKDGGWGKEQRISCSAHWVKVTVSSKEPWIDANFEITYEKHQFMVKLPDKYEVTFPNQLGCDPLRYLSTKGNFWISSVTFA